MPDRGPQDRNLRASDADRDAVAESLRAQHLAGRLDTDELQERLGRCYAAKTYAELDALISDLPGDEAATDTRIGSRRGIPRLAFMPLLPLVIVALALSHGRAVWLLVPAVFFFVIRPLRWHAPAASGCGGRHRGYL